VARAADRLARVVAMTDRAHLFLHSGAVDVSDLSPRAVSKLHRLRTKVETVCEEYWKAAVRLPSPFIREIQRFAYTDLQLPWHYVPLDLLDYFVMDLWTRASGLPYHRRADFEPPLVELPAIHASTLADARTAATKALQAAQTKTLPPGYRPKKTAAGIVRNVQWLVQVTVDDSRINALARAYHATAHPEVGSHDWREDRAIIKKGLQRAADLLSLTQYSYLETSTRRKI
jgi:hypothetical protein